ncbi:colanic acid biosynthesis glycosyltransferase WcaL [Anabaena subtropica]|uniref:Colanic acid biosynthesis glycosyltransferase WcaL n=1 Tax=Anabaena subtropica FACHB-260 TaxID=2692884 RepID=A0ABR8CMY2_9NOST|nr:colanic acid biosynthesis glycosyltransferase WcaL [Anabaena subtropica]MBD2344228.1 colanic acid biosynthesis glycosyltransferase WcaL [Anabaena subtropica FACHB-260]
MRIAVIVGKFPVISETFIVNQIIGLILRGHKVAIYSMENVSQNEFYKIHPDVENYHLLEIAHNQPHIPQNYVWRVFQGIKLIATNFHKAPLVILRSLNFFKYGRRAASLRLLYLTLRMLNFPAYDIIHCQFGIFALDAMILRDIGAIKGKLITSFRGYDISWFVQKYGKNVYEQLFAKGDFFLTNCEFFKNRAIELGCDSEKIVVLGSGIDCSRFPFKERYLHDDGKIRIATTGRLIEKKGIEYSIRAVAQVAKIYPNIEYKIIGDGELKETLQQLIQSLNITDKIKLVGWKTQPEIIDILDQSDIFIAPSVTAKDGNQDAPVNTLKEAMIMGLPVIATTHGGIPELVQDGISGFLVPERDPEAIAAKLIDLIEHPAIWSSMGRAGHAYVESHYDMSKLNYELVQIYRQVMTNDFSIQEPVFASAMALK